MPTLGPVMVGRLVGRRLAEALLVLGAVSVGTFTLLSFTAGDAATAVVLQRDGMLTASAVAAVRADLRLDLPGPVRYLHGLLAMAQGDLGISLRTGRPVATELVSRIPPTATLATAGAVVAVLLGLSLGVAGAVSDRRSVVVPLRLVTLSMLSLPPFALAYLGVLVFALGLALLPTQGLDGWGSLVLPAAVIGVPLAAATARITEARLRATMREPFITTARARGLSTARCVVTQALPNAAVPLLVVVGNQVGYAISGTLVAESVFGWPGLGDYLVRALQFRDWYPLQASILLIAAAALIARGLAGSLAVLVDARAGGR